MLMRESFLKTMSFAAMLFMIMQVSAYNFKIDGIYYTRIGEGIVEVTSGDERYLGNILIPEYIQYQADRYKVVRIGERAFNSNDTIDEVSLPSTIESIGRFAFYGCETIKRINFPESIKTIGAYAFQNCDSLEAAILPKNVKIIETYTFSGCRRLRNLVLPDSLTTIEIGAFSYCSSLDSVILPKSIKEIKSSAFSYCSNLVLIRMPAKNVKFDGKILEYSHSWIMEIPCGSTNYFSNELKDYGSLYERNTYTYKVEAAEGGEIVELYEHQDYHTRDCDKAIIRMVAKPAKGYKFLYWTLNGKPVNPSTDYTAHITDDSYFLAHFQSDNTAVNESNIQNIKVYPNPAKDQITISGIETSDIEIFDITGRLVLKQQITEDQQIDVSNLSKGMYFIKNNQHTIKFIKE